MKMILILIISLNSSLFAKVHIPCKGLPGTFHTNPDSTIGGFVSSSATVDPTVFIASEASVCERATVIEGARIVDKASVSGTSTVRGNVEVSQNAKVYGDSYVLNLAGSAMVITGSSQVYGRAFLQGSLVVTDTAEIFGLAKILDFSQVLGDSKVCGNFVLKDFQVLDNSNIGCIQK